MAWYLSIRPVQPPFPYGTDDKNRVLFSCNYDVQAVGAIGSLEANIKDYLVAQGLGVFGTNLGIGARWTIPNDLIGPYTSIIATGGGPFQRAQTDTDNIDPLSFQIIVRSADYAIASSRAVAIYNALRTITNRALP